MSTAGGDGLDASLLLLAELNFLRADDPRYVGHGERRSSADLKRGDFVFRYVEHDDFGAPANAFLVCSFWLVDALAAIGRRDEARTLFERLLACRNRHGLLAEHVRSGHRRGVGQLRADLQHGRADQLGDPAVDPVGRGVLRRSARRARLRDRVEQRLRLVRAR